MGEIVIEPAQTEKIVNAEMNQCRADGIVRFLSPKNEIGGYTRHETQSGSFRFVYYMKNDDSEAFPTLLLYIECDKPYEYTYEFKQDNPEYCNTSNGYIKGNSSWYAVTQENFSGTFTLKYKSGNENNSLKIDIKNK